MVRPVSVDRELQSRPFTGQRAAEASFRATLGLAALGLAALSLAALAAFSTAARAADYSFEWANPKPQGNPIWSVAFEDVSTGYAVGDFGTCLRTGDGGANWVDQTQLAVFRTTLNDVIVVGPGELLAVGESPGIFRSSDGGASWTPLDNPSTETLNDVQAIATGVLSAVGDSGQVLRSTDNGATWALLPLAGSGHARAQFWWNASDGFVVGDFLDRRTTDGGTTWSDIPGVGDTGVHFLTDVHFTDPMNGWILEHFTTYRTTDGGASWFEKHNVNGPVYQEAAHYVSTSERIVLTGTEGATIWRTTDDGLSWSLLYARRTTDGYTDIRHLDDGALVVCSNDGDLLRSTDAGETWVNFTRGPEDAERNVLEALALHPGGLAFAGGRGQLWLRSTDGGSTWEIPSAIPGIEITNAIAISPGGAALAAGYEPPGHSRTHRTTDGGLSWTVHEVAGGYVGYPRGLAFPSDDVAYLVTSGGSQENHVFRSSDGGVTWEDRSNGVGGDLRLYSIFFLDPMTGYVGGGVFASDARIWKTTDGAASWTPLPETGLDQAAIQDMHWMDESTGVVAGYRGVFRTTDGGETWTEVLAEDVRNLDFADGLHGVAGEFFAVWSTSDGGATWEEVELPWARDHHGVASFDGGFYVCGGGSVILRAEESGSSSVGIEPRVSATARLQVFPNPTRGQISFRINEALDGPILVRILDVRGREVRRATRLAESGIVSFPAARGLAAGLYFVEVSGSASGRGRFVVLDAR